jgi:hypothetical protein
MHWNWRLAVMYLYCDAGSGHFAVRIWTVPNQQQYTLDKQSKSWGNPTTPTGPD